MSFTGSYTEVKRNLEQSVNVSHLHKSDSLVKNEQHLRQLVDNEKIHLFEYMNTGLATLTFP